MAIQKAFVVKNSLEVSKNLIFANSDTKKVGIGSTNPQFTLDVAGGIGVTNLYSSGVGTFISRLDVGTNGNSLRVFGAGGVGIGTNTLVGSEKLLVDGNQIIRNGNLGIRTTNPSSTLTVNGDVNISGATTSGRLVVTNSNSTTTGGGQIYLNGETGNRIDFNGNGASIPSFTTRSVGTKLVLYPNVSSFQVDYALGISPSTLWYSIPETINSTQHRWYAGITTIADLKGSGELVLGGVTTLTGTSNQKLQVTGGAYIKDNLGVGVTNPNQKLQIGGETSQFPSSFQVLSTLHSTSRRAAVALGGTIGNQNPDWQLLIDTNGNNIKDLAFYNTALNSSVFRIDPNGNTILTQSGSSPVATGTSSQPLQVNGGAYIKEKLGVGTTNPGTFLVVNGTSNEQLQVQGSSGGYFYAGYDNANNTARIGSYKSSVGYTNLTLNDGSISSKGYVGIGTNNPGEKLQVDGNIRIGASTTENYIAFRGTTGDDQTPYTHTFIGERIYNTGSEQSELLLFKGNDPLPLVGPDRIRLAAAEIRFDTYSSGFSGTFSGVATSPNLNNRVIITPTGDVGIGTTTPTSKLHVVGNVFVSGALTASNIITGIGIRTSNTAQPLGVGVTILEISGAAVESISVSSGIGTIVLQDKNTPVSIGTVPPSGVTAGNLWYNSNDGRTFIYYNDGDSSQWVDLAPDNNSLGSATLNEGSLSNLSLKFTNNPNTGFYSPSNGQLTFVSNGENISDITSSGISLRQNKSLTLNQGNITNVTDIYSSNVTIGNVTKTGTSNQPLQVFGGGYIFGNLGVGVTNPSYKVDVSGSSRFTSYGGPSFIEIGDGQTGNQYAYIDLVGDTTYTDYGLRLIRENTGPNAISSLLQRGTGELRLVTEDVAPILFYTANSARCIVTSGGDVGIGTINPVSKLQVIGNVTATDFNSTSDINLKQDISTIDNALSKTQDLRGVKFNWKETNRPSYGVIAQELEKVLPELVSDGDPKTVNYNGLIGLLIEAVKELSNEVEELKSLINQ